MRYDPGKAYPYPVLRTGSSDYRSGEFSIDTQVIRLVGSTNVEIKIEFLLKNQTLEHLVVEKKAELVLLVRSPGTFFRKEICSSAFEINEQFENGILAGKVELSPYLVAKKFLEKFYCETWHQDYRDMRFRIEQGSVLAVGVPHVCHIDTAEESSVASIFRLAKNPNLGDGSWNCDYESDQTQVIINMSESDYIKVCAVRINPETGSANEYLLNAVYFPALVWLLQRIDQEIVENGKGSFLDCRWFRSLEQKIEDMDCSELGTGSDRLSDAQKIFEFPFCRLQLDNI